MVVILVVMKEENISQTIKGISSLSVNASRSGSKNKLFYGSDEMKEKKRKLDMENENVQSLTTKLSDSLYRRLVAKATSEGVSLDDFVRELLAEGLVLRAWEIMERKSAMRKGFSQPSNIPRQFRPSSKGRTRSKSGYPYLPANSNGSTFNQPGPSYSKSSRRQDYNQIMDDNANFIEYVRNQDTT